MTTSNDLDACDAVAVHCALCGDDAAIGRVLSVDLGARTAMLQFANHTGLVALDLVDAAIGDDLLVHFGFAIERVATG